MATNDTRPSIDAIHSSSELRRWYWLKNELATEAKRVGVKSTGAKFVILDRICHFHDTGDTSWPGDISVKPQSNFDWHKAELTCGTVVTDNYKNTQNVRRFFKKNTNDNFKFNIALLDWFRQNTGKTLGDAVAYWNSQSQAPTQTKIKPHNQFNQYCRDFTEQNPSKGMAEARRVWALKKRLPSINGRHTYDPSDLKLTEELLVDESYGPA